MKFAATNASGLSTEAAGRRNGRCRPASTRRRAPRATGAKPYMIAVAEVTRPTSDCQLGNGRNAISPTMNASRIEVSGTPRRLTLARADGGTDIQQAGPGGGDDRVDVEQGRQPAGADAGRQRRVGAEVALADRVGPAVHEVARV